jgi:hypothetical protein
MGSSPVTAQRASIVCDTAVDSSDIRLTSWQIGCAPILPQFRRMVTQIYRKLKYTVVDAGFRIRLHMRFLPPYLFSPLQFGVAFKPV